MTSEMKMESNITNKASATTTISSQDSVDIALAEGINNNNHDDNETTVTATGITTAIITAAYLPSSPSSFSEISGSNNHPIATTAITTCTATATSTSTCSIERNPNSPSLLSQCPNMCIHHIPTSKVEVQRQDCASRNVNNKNAKNEGKNTTTAIAATTAAATASNNNDCIERFDNLDHHSSRNSSNPSKSTILLEPCSESVEKYQSKIGVDIDHNDNTHITKSNQDVDVNINVNVNVHVNAEADTSSTTSSPSALTPSSTELIQRSSEKQDAQDDCQEEEGDEFDDDDDDDRDDNDSHDEGKETCPISPHSLRPTTTTTTTETTTTKTTITTSKTILQNLILNYIPCPYKSHWSTTYQANDPCEDRHASLTNIILKSKPQEGGEEGYPNLIRMSLFTVLDGHGGPAVADYASKKLLPLLARNINRALNCDFLHSGHLDVNGTGSSLHNLGCHGRDYSSDSSNGNGNGNASHKNSNDNNIVYTVDEKCYLKRRETKNKKKKRRGNAMKYNSNICSCGYHHEIERKNDIHSQEHTDSSNIIHSDNDEEYGTLTDSDDDDDYDDDDDEHSFRSCEDGDFDEDEMNESVSLERWYKAPDGPSDNDESEVENSIKSNDVAEDAVNDNVKCADNRFKDEADVTALDDCSSISSSYNPTSKHNNSCNGNEEGDSLIPHDIQPELSSSLTTSIQQQKRKAVRSVSDDITSSMTTSPSLPVTDSSSNSSDSSTTSSATVADKDQDESGHKHQGHKSIHDLSKVIQKSFIELDEDWMNSIDVEATHQSYLVHNGKWNAGACCLVAVIIQELEPIQSLSSSSASNSAHDCGENNAEQYSCSGNNTGGDKEDDDKDDESFILGNSGGCSDAHINGGYQPGKAILYTAHVGDCRATLLTSSRCNSLPNNFDEYDSSSSEEEEEPNLERLLCHEKICKRKFAVICNNDESSVPDKRRRLNSWDIEDEGEDFIPNKSSSSLSDSSDTTIQNYEPSPLSKNLHSIDLTEDHTPYNQHESELVRRRCNDAPRALCSSTSGGIMRVAGSLSVTRALGNAYLKTPELSFHPFKDHAPYITSLPEIGYRILEDEDRILFLASDGVWERVNGENVKQCIQGYYKKKQKAPALPLTTSSLSNITTGSMQINRSFHHTNRMRMLPTRSLWEKELSNDPNEHILSKTKVSDAIASMVLNRVRKRHKFKSMQALLNLPKGNDRRTKHDDITNMTIDLQGFIL